jgi:hypothetical protein
MFSSHIISQFRFRLSAIYSSYDADKIADDLSYEINDSLLGIVRGATDEALSYAASIGAKDFIQDIDVIESGGTFLITTLSGRTDYSTPEVKNLPNLLKNGKVGKDGTVYKTIPIKKKTAKSSMEQGIDTGALQAKARAQLLDNGVNSTNRLSAMVESFSQQIRNQPKATTPQEKPTIDSFKTASSKQNPATQWVIPEKNMDMTEFLFNLNSSIANDIEQTTTSIIQKYEREFL